MVLVDIQYLHNRDEIATLIDSINAHSPRVLALDVIFPQTVSSYPEADSHLVAAIGACPQVVLAQNAVPHMDGSWFVERSFFADGYTEGAVNMPGLSLSVISETSAISKTSPSVPADRAAAACATTNDGQLGKWLSVWRALPKTSPTQ